MIPSRVKVKNLLEKLYDTYGCTYLDTDPVSFPHKYREREDQELAGLFGALLAFGQVSHIKKSVGDLLERMGKSPYEFVVSWDNSKSHLLTGFQHRFVKEDGIISLVASLSRYLRKHGSLKEGFRRGYIHGNLPDSLSKFVDELESLAPSGGRSLKFLLPHPKRRSACKRPFLFLRWMIRREGDIDLGIFDYADPADLIIPLDTHISRISWMIGLTRRKSISLPVAMEITESLKLYDPSDPVKYDFALTRIGIVEGCRGAFSPLCGECPLGSICILPRTN